MSSVLGYLFTSSAAQLAARIETMRNAEAKLISLSHRFGDDDGNSRYTMEIVDTKIPRSSVPLQDGQRCALRQASESSVDNRSATDGTDTGGDEEDDHLIMHGVRVTSNEDKSRGEGASSPPLVLLHGYANGALYYYRNLLGLTRHYYRTVYALDMLGWGLSSRPPFRTVDDSIETAEDFFVESLEAWRVQNKIPKMTLAGHSLGGYLGVAYCEKYPDRVDRLILVSPVGVPHRKDDPKGQSEYPWRYRLLFNVATRLWEAGTTPGFVIRSLPESRGRKIVSGYVEQRLPSITCPEERETLTEYLYSNATLPGSGEYCLNRLMNPLAYAKRPAVYRIPKLRVKSVSFIYGSNDWMDPRGGLEVQRSCEEMKQNGQSAPEVEVHGVRNAGHLLLLDNWEEFNAAVIIAGGGLGALPPGGPRPSRLEPSANNEGFFQKESWQRDGLKENEKLRQNDGVSRPDTA